jgi:hypothetical protein
MELPSLMNPATWYLLLAGGGAVVVALAALVITVAALLAPDRRLRHWHWHGHRTPTTALPRPLAPGELQPGNVPKC